MTTFDRAAINRQNAKKSTGPRSAAGKAASSKNARRHGLTSTENIDLDEIKTLARALGGWVAPPAIRTFAFAAAHATAELRRIWRLQYELVAKTKEVTENLPYMSQVRGAVKLAELANVLRVAGRYESRALHRRNEALGNLEIEKRNY